MAGLYSHMKGKGGKKKAAKKATGSYKPGNIRKGAKAGPGRRAGPKAKATAGSGGSTSRIGHLSAARQRRIRARRNA